MAYKNQTITSTFLRGTETITRELKVNNDGKLGIMPGEDAKRFDALGYYDKTLKEYTFLESFVGGKDKFVDQVGGYFDQLGKIFSPSTGGAYKGVGGFKAIYDVFPSTWIWQNFWGGLTAFLSIMLGVLNLLPIPALDGGHVVFLLFEIVSGRKQARNF